MRMRFTIWTVFLSASLAFGQLDSNSVTVTASRRVNLPADQLLFSISVDADLSVTYNEVLAALQGSGITASNFSGVSVLQSYSFGVDRSPQPPRLEWRFSLPGSLSNVRDTVTTLTNLQQAIAQKKNGLSLSFLVQGSSSPAQQSHVCNLTDVIADARAQAQKLADAAGLSLGVILALSSTTSNTAFTAIGVSLPTSPGNCSATVKFALR
jgi:uncharacterized protein YggE